MQTPMAPAVPPPPVVGDGGAHLKVKLGAIVIIVGAMGVRAEALSVIPASPHIPGKRLSNKSEILRFSNRPRGSAALG